MGTVSEPITLVKGKKYPYTKAGKKAARKAARKAKRATRKATRKSR